MLVLPDLAVIPDSDSSQAPAGRTDVGLASARFSSMRRLRGGWRGWLARGLQLDRLASVDTASVVAASCSAGGRGAWLATPLQLAAGMQTVHVPADGVLELEPAEARDWCRDFARVFGADGIRLEPSSPSALLLVGLDAPGVLSVEPWVLAGRSLEGALPQGPNAARLRALMAEIEMWLHEHPLNAARQRRGQPTVASLWLWGGGGAACEPPLEPPVAAAAWDRLYADDPWVGVLAGLSGVPISPPPAALDPDALSGASRIALVASPGRLVAGTSPGTWGGMLDAADRLYVRPALHALAGGQLGALTLVAGDRAIRVSASDRFRFWRPARSWARALAG